MKIDANVGDLDRNIRLGLGIALVVLFFVITGPLQWVAGVAGLVLVVTGAMRFCPAYLLVKKNTCGGACSKDGGCGGGKA